MTQRGARWAGAAGSLAGLVLFAWYLHGVGWLALAEGVGRVGAVFVVVLVLSGLRLLVRAAAWAECVEHDRLPLRQAFVAFTAGDAVGNLTPFGLLASESTKVVMAGPRLAAGPALASVALENLLYSLTVGLTVGAGALLFVLWFEPVPIGRLAGLLLAAAAALGAAVVCWILFRSGGEPGSGPRGVTARLPQRPREALARLQQRVRGFSARRPRQVRRVLGLDMAFHTLSVAEIYLLLWVLAPASSDALPQAVVLDTVHRVLLALFKFVPLRVGVDEAGSGLVAQALGLGPVVGVTLALTRKARTLVWAALGVAFLAARGLPLRPDVR